MGVSRMSVSKTSTIISPYRFFTGQHVFTDDCKKVAQQLNYTWSRAQAPLAIVNSFSYSSSDFNPHLQDRHYTSNTYVYDFFIWVDDRRPSILTLGHTALVPTATNVVTVTFEITGLDSGSGSQTDTTTNAQSLTEQTVSYDPSGDSINGDGTGWMRVRVGWYRSSGAATDNRLVGFRIQAAVG